MTQISPARRALPWLYWMLFFVAVGNITALTSYGAVEYFARVLVTGIVYGGGVFAVAWFVYRLRAQKT